MFNTGTSDDESRKKKKTGMALKSLPGSRVVVQCVDGAKVTKNAHGGVIVVDRSFFHPGMVVVHHRGCQAGVVTAAATTLDLVRLDGGEGCRRQGRVSGRGAARTGALPRRLRRLVTAARPGLVVGVPRRRRGLRRWRRCVQSRTDRQQQDDDERYIYMKRDSLNCHTNYSGQEAVIDGDRQRSSLGPGNRATPSMAPQCPRSRLPVCSQLGLPHHHCWRLEPTPLAEQLPAHQTIFCPADELNF